jgi:hypothetical protein
MDNSVDYYQAQDIARTAASEACHDLRNELSRESEIDRRDWRESDRDIRDGLSEINERLWHIEVKLGIRHESGRWIGYGNGESSS